MYDKKTLILPMIEKSRLNIDLNQIKQHTSILSPSAKNLYKLAQHDRSRKGYFNESLLEEQRLGVINNIKLKRRVTIESSEEYPFESRETLIPRKSKNNISLSPSLDV